MGIRLGRGSCSKLAVYERDGVQLWPPELMYYGVFDQGCKKHEGSLPLIGVKTFLSGPSVGDHCSEIATEIELIRSTEEAKGRKIANVKRHGEARNGLVSDSLKVRQQMARDRRNVFEQLIEAMKYNLLGQISHALYDLDGEYRWNM